MTVTKRRILIVVRESRKEINEPTFGGSRLVRELVAQFIMMGFKVSILSMFDLRAPVARLLAIKGKDIGSVARLRKFLRNDKARWILVLLYSLVVEVLSYIDVKLRKEIEKIYDQVKPDIILYNGPIGAFIFLNIARRKGIPFILCEHNVDFYFYQDKIGMNPLVNAYKLIELLVCKFADLVICFNPWDKLRLVKNGIRSEKIFLWKFISMPRRRVCDKREALNKIPEYIQEHIKDKFVVGFVGAYYSPNILAVKYILKIAEKLPNVIFLVIGSVGEAFKGSKIPSNVIITGYVKHVEPYIAVADVLLNLKFTSATGVEAKMFDYLRFNKPIISTKIGAMGFEHIPNIIIIDNLNEIIKKIEELAKVSCK